MKPIQLYQNLKTIFMTRKKIIYSSVIAVVAVAATVLVVKALLPDKKHDNSRFKDYISAYTSGMISSESTIKVQLAMDYADTSMFNKPVEDALFDFSPNIKGTAYWLDSRTIEFRPEKKLPHKEKYEAEFYLSKIIKVPDSLSTLKFDFQIIQQAFDVTIDNIKPYDKKSLRWEKIIGTVKTADVADAAEFEKLLEAIQEDKKLHVTWTHEEDKHIHHFQIDSVSRKEKASSVTLKWNASELEADKRADDIVQIPALGDFVVTNVVVEQTPDQHIIIQFSDPLLEDQNLEGLIKVEKVFEEKSDEGTPGTTKNIENLKFYIEDNEIRVYPEVALTGTGRITVEKVKNIEDKPLPKKFVQELLFEGNKPAIKIVGKGNIIPSSNGLILPFEAVNLKAVDIKIIKIFENNVAQFLQVNDLAGNSELYRVGQVVKKKTIMLTSFQITDFSKWNRFSIDLSELINAEQGAIYKVIISFNKSYSLYPCNGVVPKLDEPVKIEDNGEEDEEIGRYDYYGNSYYDDEYYYEGESYDWSQRDNPCNISYYSNKSESRNIIASDLGIIAKRGNNGSMNFFVTDIVTTKPLSGVKLELYTFQHQLMETLTTDGDGIATTTLKKSPYLLVALKGKQRGYLKLDDGSSLSLSSFDVKGEVVQKGIKGFIYGERGVWRPGDSLFLTFILEDKNKTLPDKHPVSFDLLNPQGQVIKHVVSTTSVNGFYNFSTSTEPNAPTGTWMARVKVGSVMFTKDLKIETIMPNRLKINLDFGTDKLSKDGKKTATLNAKWLHGAIAKNLKADVQVNLSQTTTTFSKFPDYIFDDASRSFSSENITIFSEKLDQNGNAAVVADFNIEKEAPGVLKASFQTRVFEESGAFSIDRFSILYYPYKSFVGMLFPKGDKFRDMIVTNTNHVIKIANVDANGNLILTDNKIKVDVYKIDWHWWWDNSEDRLSNYVNSSYHTPIQTRELTTFRGMCSYTLRIDKPDWGNYFVRVTDVESGHSAGKVIYIDWPEWSGRSRDGNTENVTMLSFTSDKEKYKVGENVKLSIPSGPDGRALVSIETGSKVLKTFWIETTKGFTEFSFPVTEEMAPNVYAHVTLLQPHAQTKNDLPIRLYGVIPINIEDPNTHLRPLIIMPNKLKPEQNASITVKEENGKAMAYTIAIVDEGLLDITRFKTPDPWNSFYAREALGVKTWDLFDFVMGAYGGELERILSIGGDGEIDRSKAAKTANRFKPMVKFFGPFFIDKGVSKTHTFMMPQYVGSVRVMVIAGYNGAYGFTDKTVAVKKPLMILGTLPRVIGPGESFKLPVDVFAMEKFVKNVSIKVTSNSLLAVVGANNKNTYFKRIGDNIVEFDMKANYGIGIGKVDIVAVSGNETAKYSVEINVRNPNPKVVNVVEAMIKPGETWNATYALPGISGTNKGVIEVSSTMPMNLEKRIRYLINYPHGCIEQTTSSGFPQLYLTDLMELQPGTKGEIERNIKATIQKIYSFQVSSGGFSYWPGELEANEWGSSYGGHFLIEAANKGYTVPHGILDRWKKYQKDRANQWTAGGSYYNYDLIQAYRLFTLALAKAPELGAMNRLREQNNLSLAARWRLAAAYQLAGYSDIASKLISGVSTEVKHYRELYYSYGSDDRDEAMILEALTLMGQQTKAFQVAKRISAALCSNEWMSTQTTSYCLLAMSKFFKGNSTSSEVNYTYSINGGAVNKAFSNRLISQAKMKLNGSAGKGKAMIKNEGKSVLYGRIVLEGIPQIGDNTAASNNIEMQVVYKSVNGTLIDPSNLEQGTDFIAEVVLQNSGIMGDLKEVALSMTFPSGWEIHNTRMDEGDSKVQTSTFNYQDIRDDRVYTYFDLPSGTSKTFRFLLNASYVGEYYLPTVQVEAMYDATISARVPGRWVKVVSGK